MFESYPAGDFFFPFPHCQYAVRTPSLSVNVEDVRFNHKHYLIEKKSSMYIFPCAVCSMHHQNAICHDTHHPEGSYGAYLQLVHICPVASRWEWYVL